MTLTRREFGLAGSVGLLATLSPRAAAAATDPRVKQAAWYDTVKRIGQTNLNERDPEHGDPERWAAFWASAKAQAVLVSVSGPIAFYPSKIPFFHHSRRLGERDFVGECVSAARKRGLRIIGRMSPDHQWYDEATAAAHPSWFRRLPDGKPILFDPNIAITCHMSDYFSDQLPRTLEEILDRYEFDGMFTNGWPTIQKCYCDTCRKIGDPNSAVYQAALQKQHDASLALFRGMILKKNPGGFFTNSFFGGFGGGDMPWRLSRSSSFSAGDAQGRPKLEDPVWDGSIDAKIAQSLMRDRPYALVTSGFGSTSGSDWRHISNTTAESLSRMAQTAASGGVVWHHMLGMTQSFSQDQRWQELVKPFFNWMAANDIHFQNKRPLAKVGVLISPRSMEQYKAPAGNERATAVEGICKVLVENRIAYDFVHVNDLGAERLAQYDTLLLPNVALMSDAQATSLRQFAQRGGSLIATFETGLYDETGKPRADFALADVFGIHKIGDRQKWNPPPFTPQAMHYQALKGASPLTDGFGNTPWIAGPLWRIPLAPVADAPATFMPLAPDGPPEMVFANGGPTNEPAVVMRQVGKARMVYFAGDNDASYERADMPDLGRQLANAVRWTLGDDAGLTVSGDGLIEVNVWETQAGFAVHLLNYNAPNALNGRLRKPIPLGTQSVTLTLPTATKVRRIDLLEAGEPVEFTQEGRTVRFALPSVGFYEVAALIV
ncbi:alpha-amylase family protein [Sphingopyxis sp.]|jgi:hypothetical protein|uniref:alpha-amylase family protein n=1 Tax=Sphingopyxis sp. TaxID=1908224 RepID=UPI002DF359B3|nr:alpha-amylase family protein [Sphingopyxis sp.]